MSGRRHTHPAPALVLVLVLASQQHRRWQWWLQQPPSRRHLPHWQCPCPCQCQCPWPRQCCCQWHYHLQRALPPPATSLLVPVLHAVLHAVLWARSGVEKAHTASHPDTLTTPSARGGTWHVVHSLYLCTVCFFLHVPSSDLDLPMTRCVDWTPQHAQQTPRAATASQATTGSAPVGPRRSSDSGVHLEAAPLASAPTASASASGINHFLVTASSTHCAKTGEPSPLAASHPSAAGKP